MIEILCVGAACAVVGGLSLFGIGCVWLASNMPWNRGAK